MPVGRCVTRIAESVLLTCWPPAPEARKVSMRSSAGIEHHLADRVGLGQDRDGAGRGVDAALRLGLRHALHAMAAGFELELRVRALPGDARDHLLVAAQLRGALGDQLDLPALALGVARVHAEQVAGEERRLVAAGAGAHLEEQVAVVVRVARQQRLLQLGLELLHRAPAPTSAPRRRSPSSTGRRPCRAPSAASRSACGSGRRARPRGVSSACSRESFLNSPMSRVASSADSSRFSSSSRFARLSSFVRSEGFKAAGSSANAEQARERVGERAPLLAGRLVQRLRRRVHQLVGEALRQRLEHLLRVVAPGEQLERALDFVPARVLGLVAQRRGSAAPTGAPASSA